MQTGKIITINTHSFNNSLNTNGFNSSLRRHWLDEWIKKKVHLSVIYKKFIIASKINATFQQKMEEGVPSKWNQETSRYHHPNV